PQRSMAASTSAADAMRAGEGLVAALSGMAVVVSGERPPTVRGAPHASQAGSMVFLLSLPTRPGGGFCCARVENVRKTRQGASSHGLFQAPCQAVVDAGFAGGGSAGAARPAPSRRLRDRPARRAPAVEGPSAGWSQI